MNRISRKRRICARAACEALEERRLLSVPAAPTGLGATYESLLEDYNPVVAQAIYDSQGATGLPDFVEAGFVVWNDNADNEDGYRFEVARVDRDADVQDPAGLSYPTIWEIEEMDGGFCAADWGTDLDDWSIYYMRLVAFNQDGDSPADYARLVATPLPKAPVITSVSLDYVYEDEEWVPVTTLGWDYDQSIGGTEIFEVEIISQTSGAHEYEAVLSGTSSNTYEYRGIGQTNQNTVLFRVHAVYRFEGVDAYNEPVTTYYYSPPSAIAGGELADTLDEGVGGLIANGAMPYEDPVRFSEDAQEDAAIREQFGISTHIQGMLALNVDPWGNLGGPGIAGKMDIDMQAIASGQGLGEWSAGAAWGTPTAFIGMSFGPAGVEGLQGGVVNGFYRGWNNWNLSTGPSSPFWEQPGTVVSFWSDGVVAESVVEVGAVTVTHLYYPSDVSPCLYECLVMVDGSSSGYYSRTMNWTGQYARVEGLGQTFENLTTYGNLNGEQLTGDTDGYVDIEAYGEGAFADQHATTMAVDFTGQSAFTFVFGAAETEADILQALAGYEESGTTIIVADSVEEDPVTELQRAAGGVFMQAAAPTKQRWFTANRNVNNNAGNTAANRLEVAPGVPNQKNWFCTLHDPSQRGFKPDGNFMFEVRNAATGAVLQAQGAPLLLFNVTCANQRGDVYAITITNIGAAAGTNYDIFIWVDGSKGLGTTIFVKGG